MMLRLVQSEPNPRDLRYEVRVGQIGCLLSLASNEVIDDINRPTSSINFTRIAAKRRLQHPGNVQSVFDFYASLKLINELL
jgi:hypothetical protein